MLTKEGFAFFHRILFVVTKLGLHPFTMRKDLLVDAESKRTHLVGWTTVLLYTLHVLLVIRGITIARKIEGIIDSFLILGLLSGIAAKITIQLYHSELIQVINNILLLNRKLGKTNLNCYFFS